MMRGLRNKKAGRACVTIMAVLCGVLWASGSVYSWSRHDISFEVPDGGFVTYSSNTHFEIRWDEMVVTIALYDKSNTDEKVIREDLRRDALDYNLYDTKEGKVKTKCFKGVNIEGTMPDGSRALITSLSSKKTDVLVKVTINYLYGNREVVDEIVKSVTEGKEEMLKRQKNKEKRQQKIQKKADAEREKQLREQEEKEREKQLRRANEKVYEV